MRKRPAEPVEIPDDEGVTGRERGEGFGQPRPLGARACRQFALKGATTSCLLLGQ